ncbi:probable tRNA (guanine(26)-N(2))-dimethyltransferase isoform X2 [Diachasma alloeum]|uniref:probable tRNA (guanine(26)-N(2))-dimethyltransferase isoform X2 n=1 Tax=Diachasma alloeum TaxID=454923 RepID=UPI0007381B4E|nr:probable tRNA (guanine(26)-N(2))-dimethyltransferase isoform X2 [Diachasma alloeum]
MEGGETQKIIKEGKAEILVLEKNVFYNPVQEFNRDLSVAVLSLIAKEKHENFTAIKTETVKINPSDQAGVKHENGITILEALSATGLRSIRYAKEVPYVRQIIANDISAKAVESIKRNIQHNKIEDLVTPSHEDATMVMYQNRKTRFDAVDLDPYGCPSIFLDGAVQCLDNGGLLLVTATDMAVLAGNSPETCFVKYGAVSLKSKACHEIIGGPIWLGPLHDQPFVRELIDSIETMNLTTSKRLIGVLNVVTEELDTPLYYVLDRLMSIVRCDTPSMVKFRSGLLNAGYNVSFSHAHRLSIKTDAPAEVIWDVVRAWEKIHPAKREKLGKESPALAILTTESTKEISFDLHSEANPESRRMHMQRFQVNPTVNWGPGARSTTIIDLSEKTSKRARNQNKHKKKFEETSPSGSPPLKQQKSNV